MRMYKLTNSRLKEIFKLTGAYIFLYVAFIFIFYNFAYDAWICSKPIGLMFVFLKALMYYVPYLIFNHLLLKKIVGLKTVVIFETILLVIIFSLNLCYASIENRYHGRYNGQKSCCLIRTPDLDVDKVATLSLH